MNWQTYMKETYHDFEPLTEYKIGCLLFPDSEVDPAEKIRKTVKPKAYEALGSVEKMRFELGDSWELYRNTFCDFFIPVIV